MINKEDTEQIEEIKQPDENSGILVQGFFKITDPDTGEIIVQGRS
jgi:hypothetical protein